MSAPLVALEPDGGPAWLVDAVQAGGGIVTSLPHATALVWYGRDASRLQRIVGAYRSLRWVQLVSAGVENYAELTSNGMTWTCAKGIYGEAVAEHALALVLAAHAQIPYLARLRQWDDVVGSSLYDSRRTIVGAGGITRAMLPLIRSFRVDVTIVRDHPKAVDGARVVVTQDGLLDALSTADCVLLACPVTPATKGMIGVRELGAMRSDSLLVNVARGQLVDTSALVAALTRRVIAGAALDVTEPEPLPKDHPFWRMDNVLITPHSANPDKRGKTPLADLVRDNVRRFGAGLKLRALVNADLGY